MASITVNITESITATMDMKNKKRTPLLIVAGILGLIFLACVGWLIVDFVQQSRADEQLEYIKDNYIVEVTSQPMETFAPVGTEIPVATEIPAMTQESVVSPVPTEEPTPDPESILPGLEGYDVPEKHIDFAQLQKEQNEHIYAWITVPGTVIDYPVLQHPEEIGYYLEHNLDHSKGYPGCIYSQLYNSKEWDDPITSLYGHNMNNGTMFAGLHQYRDSKFFKEHPYIYIYTEDKIRVYEIFAAYEYTNVDLVLMEIYGGEETYAEYLKSIYTLDGWNNNFNTEIEVTTADKVLTLVTCIANKPSNRYLVQGVLVAEGNIEP